MDIKIKYIAQKVIAKTKVIIESKKIKKSLHKADSVRVIVGAGSTSYNGWISTDYPLLDICKEQSWHELFELGMIDALLAEHVFEHLTDNEVELALFNSYKFIKKGGYIRIAVPDGFHSSRSYIDLIKPGGTGIGSDDHKQLFNYTSLSEKLITAGFSVKLLEWYDEYKVFNYRDWVIEDGLILRSSSFDERNINNPNTYTSLIIDAVKE